MEPCCDASDPLLSSIFARGLARPCNDLPLGEGDTDLLRAPGCPGLFGGSPSAFSDLSGESDDDMVLLGLAAPPSTAPAPHSRPAGTDVERLRSEGEAAELAVNVLGPAEERPDATELCREMRVGVGVRAREEEESRRAWLTPGEEGAVELLFFGFARLRAAPPTEKVLLKAAAEAVMGLTPGVAMDRVERVETDEAVRCKEPEGAAAGPVR